MTRQRWAVVGGGVMGLWCAYRAADAGHDVTLYEAAPELGGLASAWTLYDEHGQVELTWDRHYHVTLLSDSYTRRLLDVAGLESEVRWQSTQTGFFDGRRLSPLSNAVDYLRLPTLNPIEKVRLAGTIMMASRRNDWANLEELGVEAWLTRWSGRGVFEKLWKPLLRSKLGDGYRDASAAFIWATIQRLYAARRNGLKVERFGYVPGGYARVFAAIASRLESMGVTLRLGTPVQVVGSTEGEAFDRVLMTASPRVAASLCPMLTGDEKHRLNAIAYQGIVCASLVLDRPLSPYYLTYLTGGDSPFTAVVDMSALVDPNAEFFGRGLVYLPRYARSDGTIFAEDDATIRRRFLDGLRQVYLDFDLKSVRSFAVSRVREVFPLPVLGYSRAVPSRETSIRGLYLVNSAQIVNGTLNVNDSVRTADQAMDDLLNAAESTGPAIKIEGGSRG
ncbi:MAG: FAD-dependent oxidoreductase [Planctomycetota bacterium]